MNDLQITGAEAILKLGIYRHYVQLSRKGGDIAATGSQLSNQVLRNLMRLLLVLSTSALLLSRCFAVFRKEGPKRGEWYSQVVLTGGARLL